METKDSLNKIALCLDTDYTRTKIAVYEILSTICYIHGHDGHQYVHSLYITRLASHWKQCIITNL